MEFFVYFLTPLTIPLIFTVLGIVSIWKGFKVVLKWTAGCKKIMADCIDVQQIQEEGTTLYRPVFEYTEDGRRIRATKLEYDYENPVYVGNMVPIIVDKKHPDLVMDVGKGPALATQYAKMVVGVIFTFFGLQAVFIIVFVNVLGLFEY